MNPNGKVGYCYNRTWNSWRYEWSRLNNSPIVSWRIFIKITTNIQQLIHARTHKYIHMYYIYNVYTRTLRKHKQCVVIDFKSSTLRVIFLTLMAELENQNMI